MEFPLIPTILLLLLTTFLFLYALKSSRNKRKLPPGREGLPLLGETLQIFAAYRSEDPEPFLDDRVRKYGRVFTTHAFGERTVFSVDPEFNRALLAAEGKTVEASYPSSIATLLGEHALLITKGSRHKRLHSLTLNRLASPSTIRDSPLMTQIDRLVKRTLESWGADGGGRVMLMDQTKKITFELTVKQLMSFDPGEWTEALRREYVRVVDGFFAIPLPEFLPFFSFTTYGKAIKARTKVADALKEVIRARKAERLKRRSDDDADGNKFTEDRSSISSSGGKNTKKQDMLDELLDLEPEEGEDEMVDFMISILVAGYETTSTIMTLAVKYLTDKPHALQLLREEHEGIRAKKGDEDEPLDWSDYKSMHFTQCVINETLRVANIIGGVFRRALTDIDFNEYTVPKGCKIIVSLRGVHLDPEHYEDARTFNPWRWQKTDAVQQASSACKFIPFGGGPRLCPGYELARVIIATFLHYLVTLYSWEEAEKDRIVFLPTTRAVKGYPINVKRREKVGRGG